MVSNRNIIHNRYIFHCKNQDEESFDIYFAEISKLVQQCEYRDKEMTEEMLRDKIVFGVKNIKVKKELLRRENLTLHEAVNICKASEATEKQLKTFSNGESLVRKIKDKEESNSEKKKKKKKCKFCGNIHEFIKGACPAWGKLCSICNGRNHTEKVCKKKIKEIKKSPQQAPTQPSSSSDADSDCEDNIIINKITNDQQKNLAECSLKFKSDVTSRWIDITCLLDTAADECLIGYKNLKKMFSESFINKNLKPSRKCLYSFGGHNIFIHGQIDIWLKVTRGSKSSRYKVTFQVVHTPHIPLLSCKACVDMGLVKFCKEVKQNHTETDTILMKYESVFEGQGCFEGEIDLEVDANVKPVIQKPRRIPVSLRKPLQKELARLVEEGIIEKEDMHTDWKMENNTNI
ncbi:uncharacterized protein LOC126381184 [Pectinophora gossypiella]|uniref:uncharacterized protein LOC126381184 n=1 Tax=Pectinophora gossypiella TaxID=13191 RepID=UPI00214F3A26|nr:uncharacterized protein LOC126381184 [Pectinophora gossypiella]